jgi:hypothetical protein
MHYWAVAAIVTSIRDFIKYWATDLWYKWGSYTICYDEILKKFQMLTGVLAVIMALVVHVNLCYVMILL